MIEHGAIRRRGYKATSAAILALTTTLAGAAVMPASASASPAQASHAAPATAHHGYSEPVTGTAEDGTEDGAQVTGTFTPRSFHVNQGHLVVTGVLRGTIEGHGDFQRIVTTQVQDVATGGASAGTAAPGACDILTLDLGPLDLDLLGLQVHLDEVVLDITAQSGPGNLLGNLLCQVAGLLDQGGGLGNLLNNLLGQLSGLLNQILGALGTV